MKKFNLYILLLFIVLICCFPFKLFAKDKITWIYVNYPPFGIREGSNKDKGMLDLVTNYMQIRLIEYEHEKQIGNIKRMILILENKQEIICTCGFNKTPERKNKFYFSMPALIYPGVGITTRKSLLRFFKGENKVSLADILENKNLKLGIHAKRSFGERIDPLVKKYLNEKNVYSQSLEYINESLLNMLLYKRLDYILARPYEAVYIARKMNKENEIVNIPLKEAENYLISYIACSKNEKSRQVIEKINTIIENEASTSKYRSFMETWLDKNYINEFRKVYKDIF